MTTSMTRRSFLLGSAGMAALSKTKQGAGSTDADGSSSKQDNSKTSASQQQSVALESFDMHTDTVDLLGMVGHKPYSGYNDKYSGSLASTNAMVSIDRMRGARWVQCYAIWTPDAEGNDTTELTAAQWYREAVTWFKGQMDTYVDIIEQVRSFSDIPSILDKGKVAAILTIENAACLNEGLHMVDEFAKDGVLIAGLTWNYQNALGAGVVYPEVGLTDLGKQYVAALEDHGIVADVSHLNEKGFWELEKIATKPYVATHSNARAINDQPRNLSDDQFATIVERGGLVGLNFFDGLVRNGGHVYGFDELAAHVEHWLGMGGEDVIALGSDRDGSSVPTWLADCSSQDLLFDRFAQRFGKDITKKLFFDNAMGFFTKRG